MHVSRSFPRWMVLIICKLMLWNTLAMAQEIPEVTGKDLPGYTVNRNESFNGASLWGYMNGGADIYLEYGFDILRVEEFSAEGENITLELFKMDDPVSAFGIYSIKIFRCRDKDVIARPDCLNPYQYQLAYGNYYVQLVNESGTGKVNKDMIAIVEVLIYKLDKAGLDLPVNYLTDSLHFTLDEIKLLKGPLGVQDKAQPLFDYLKDMEGYQVFLAKTAMDGKRITYYEIVFDSPDIKEKFLETYDPVTFQLLTEDGHNLLLRLKR